MSNLQFRFTDYRFRPTFIGTLATICCIPLFIKLGFWQYGKAEQKQALQVSYAQYEKSPPVLLPEHIENIEDWRYRPVKVSGDYLTQYQILLDNQIEGEVAGYHVVTPLQIEHSKRVVLVDRGWVPASDNHNELPDIKTPTGLVEVAGKAWIPSTKFYTLEAGSTVDTKQAWQAVWQNMDLKRYLASVPFDTLPIVIRLDATSEAGGFVRNWIMPDDRVMTNISYAYQWFGFAVATLAIYLFVSFKNIKTKD